MSNKRIHLVGPRILVPGLTFKQNCPGLRNTRVVDAARYHARLTAIIRNHG